MIGLAIVVFVLLLKKELRISAFQHFLWFARHRLSVHITAVPNLVKEHVSNKVNLKLFYSSENKMADKNRFGPELTEAGIDGLVDKKW